jgi:nucleotidyltransferase substrate binding protein (TIGR01987 family)
MRERLKKYFGDFSKALKNLKIATETAEDDLQIDGAIKRFELCYELSWKLMKLWLEDKGIICKTPRDCFKQAFINELINDETAWMRMIDDRNILVHTYTGEESRDVFLNVKQVYIHSFEHLHNKIAKETENE